MNQDGVSDVIGTVLLVGITVTVAAVFGFVILNQDGPDNTQHAQIAFSLNAGPDGSWSTGDEYIQLRHRGGEPFYAYETTIRVTIGNATTSTTGASLTGGFADGDLTIGETWTYTVTAAIDEVIEVKTITPRQLHSDWTNNVGGGITPTPCAPDVTSPVITSLTITPSNVNTATVGSVQVQAAVTEACGIQSVALTYDAGGAPTTVAMSLSGSWQATIPDLGWSGLSGETLALSVLATDTATNTATEVLNDLIEPPTIFPFYDANCDGDFDGGSETDLTTELADGAYTAPGECVVFPSGWGVQSRLSWAIDVGSLTSEVDLTSTAGKVDLRTQVGNLDIEGTGLTASTQIRLRSELALLASNSAFTAPSIDIDDDGSSTTMDFGDAAFTANGGMGDNIDIQNGGASINAPRAVFTSNGGIIIRAELAMVLSSTTFTARSIDIDAMGSSTTMDFRDAVLTANGGTSEHIDIRNDGTTLNLERATFTSNGNVALRTEELLSASFTTMTAAGGDITLRGFDTIEIVSAVHTAGADIAITTNPGDTVFVSDYCGNEAGATIPVTGIIDGLPRIGACDLLS